MIHSVIFPGMILNVKGMRYKVIAVRPNGKVTMKPIGPVPPRRIAKPAPPADRQLKEGEQPPEKKDKA